MITSDSFKIFTPEQEKRLDAIRELLAPLDEREHEIKQELRRLDDEAREAVLRADCDRLVAEMEPLRIEEKQLELIKDFAEEFENKIRPKLEIADALIKALPGPTAEVAAAGIAALLETFERLDDTHARYRRLVAKQRMNALKAYTSAGFSDQQAMALLVAEAQASSPLDALRENLKVNFKA